MRIMRSMTQKAARWFILFIGIIALQCHAADRVIQHDIEVSLFPEEQTLRVKDRIHLPRRTSLDFTLHAGLDPLILTPGVQLRKLRLPTLNSYLHTYRITLPDDLREFTLEYGGKISHAFRTLSESPGRSRQLLSGSISSDGVFLDAGVAWYPVFADTMQTFRMQVTLPEEWLAISQGDGPSIKDLHGARTVSWSETHPQDDIYLIAAPFHFYSQDLEKSQAQVYLRSQDPALARRYLDATEHYLDLYQTLIGPYPYAKFALVENFWETGYGMPSFTLLGPQVIRLPFILHTSFPHEILHNWWGNGVYVDYQTGNWSEGLTAYLADHLLKEQQEQGIGYRRSALQRFNDFVHNENDFPLSEFHSRHTTASQAVGYDKSLMLFHMLRRKLGDQPFIDGLRRFYQRNLFQTAGFPELQEAFEAVSDTDLDVFFDQWTHRTGAPALAVKDVEVTPTDQGLRLSGELVQTQDEEPFQLEVPLIVYPEQEQPIKRTIELQSRSEKFSIDLPTRPVRLDIDPWFDLFRQLHDSEAPPTFGKLFGAEKALFVLPAKASQSLLDAYKQMAEYWGSGYAESSILLDSELEALPDQGNVWLLGWENRFLPATTSNREIPQLSLRNDAFMLSGETYQKQENSLVLVYPTRKSAHLGFIAGHSATAIAGLTRKVPHYGKYSYLVFSGEQPTNRLKGQWDILESPLRIKLSDSKVEIVPLQPEALWPRSQKEITP